jgi:hypothetical protein
MPLQDMQVIEKDRFFLRQYRQLRGAATNTAASTLSAEYGVGRRPAPYYNWYAADLMTALTCSLR